MSKRKPFDIQVNGYQGVDFCSDSLQGEDFHKACRALRADGVDSILATVITDHITSLVSKIANMVRLREEDDLIREMVKGFHVEGPFINGKEGFVGAHPPDCVSPASADDAKRIVEAGRGLVRLFTLAPECDEDFATTRYLVDQGIVVSAGHCDSTIYQLRGAIDAGLTMITHLGNGCPVVLPRHDNFIQRALSLSDELWICFIPDGAHVDFFALQNYMKICGVERTIMTTDAISAAGLGPGVYQLSGHPVEIDEYGVARRPGSPNLAGSTIRMPKLVKNLSEELLLCDKDINRVISDNPRAALLIA